MHEDACSFYHRAILAPMVRVGSPGFRALCIHHGADVVFTEEVVAAKLVTCRREVVQYPTVDTPMAEFVSYEAFKNAYKRTVVLSTPVRSSALSSDGSPTTARTTPVVLQLGVADPERGAAAALVCSDDIDGVDINMGCPKKFSIANGFGAALMKKPQVGGAIVRAVYDAVNTEARVTARGQRRIAISLKTRLKNTAESTAEMLRAILVAAQHTPSNRVLHAITIHARVPEQRSEEAPLYERAAEVVRLCKADELFTGICFVLNGSILSRQDGEWKGALYGFDGAMLARAALEDARCFEHNAKEAIAPAGATSGVTPARESSQAYALSIAKELLLYSIRYRTLFNNFKYHLTRMFPAVEPLKPLMETVQLDLRCYADCYDFFHLSGEERELAERCAHTLELLLEKPPLTAKRAADRDVKEGDDQLARKAVRTEGDGGRCAEEGVHCLT